MTPSVALFNKLGWIPFYEQPKIDKCTIMYKRINGTLPNYLNEHLILNNKRHSRNTRYSSTNAVCPKYKRETEGGRSFAVSATRLWNSTPIEIRKLNSVACFKKNMFANIFKEQQLLHHFVIYICYLPAGRSVWGKTVTEVLKILPEAVGRGQHFQDRGHSFSPYGPTLSR